MSGRECKTCDRTQNSSSQQMPCKMETCVEFPMAPQIAAAEHRKNYDVAGLSMELECLDDGQGTERDKIASWSARMVANVVGVKKNARNGVGTMLEPLTHDWSSMDREMQYECAGGHQGSYAQLGWTCGKAGLQRNLCEGSEMSRPIMVEMETAKLERGGGRQNGLVHTHNGSESTGGRTWLLGRSPSLLGTRMVCRKRFKTTRGACVLLKTVEGGSNFRNVERALYRWSRVPRGPKRVRHDWDDCSGCLADGEEDCEGEIWRALATPLSISSQLGHCRDAVMVQCWIWLDGIV